MGAIALQGSYFLLSIGVALLVAILPLYCQAKSITLKNPKQKERFVMEIARGIRGLLAVSLFALVVGALLPLVFH